MTAVADAVAIEEQVARSAGPRHASSAPPDRSRVARWVVGVAAGVVFCAAALARLLFIDRSYELFLDEVTYTVIARNVAQGDGVVLYGEPFFLHPAGFFWTMGGLLRLRSDGPVDVLVFWLRPANAVLGAGVVLLMFLLVRRLSGSLSLALVAGAVLAVDPFLVRFDSRVMLETQATLCTVAGYLVLTRRRGSDRAELAIGAAAGLLMCCAVLTKEPYAFSAVLPIIVLLVLGVGPRRRRLTAALAATVGLYLAYVGSLASTGQLGAWWASKTSGIARLVGASQETGFNAPAAEPLTSRLVAMVTQFAATYTLLGAGSVAVLVLALRLWRRSDGISWSRLRAAARRTDDARVLAAAWAVCVYGYLGYAVLGGTLEEQTFYLLVPPATAAVAVAVRRTWVGHGRRFARPVAAVCAVVVLAAGTASWVVVHTRPDDGYRQLLVYLAAHVPHGSRIAVTEETAQFLLPRYDVRDAATLTEVQEEGIEYVLISAALAERGYGLADGKLLSQMEALGRPVFDRDLPTLGRLVLFDVRSPHTAPADDGAHGP